MSREFEGHEPYSSLLLEELWYASPEFPWYASLEFPTLIYTRLFNEEVEEALKSFRQEAVAV